MTPALLSPTQVDALREIANIGSGYAATSLSQLSGMTIMIDVPSIQVATLTDVARRIGGSDKHVVTISMQMLGDLTGHTLFILPERNASLLCDVLLQRAPGTSNINGELEQSSLLEAGNIMAGSFLNGLSAVLGKMLLPSVPSVLIETPEILASSTGQGIEDVLLVETSFQCNEANAQMHDLTGVFLFVLDDEESVCELFQTITA